MLKEFDSENFDIVFVPYYYCHEQGRMIFAREFGREVIPLKFPKTPVISPK
jgi:hypothetical protein